MDTRMDRREFFTGLIAVGVAAGLPLPTGIAEMIEPIVAPIVRSGSTLSRAQLCKELLPGLNALFKLEYDKYPLLENPFD